MAASSSAEASIEDLEWEEWDSATSPLSFAHHCLAGSFAGVVRNHGEFVDVVGCDERGGAWLLYIHALQAVTSPLLCLSVKPQSYNI